MTPVYAGEEPTTDHPGIFLAGPTPRNNQATSWRPRMLKILTELNWPGYVYIPESRNKSYLKSYIDHVQWEEDMLLKADCILFWIARHFPHMPGQTTNDEWGFWKDSGKVVLGYPKWAERIRYQHHYAVKYNVPISNSMTITANHAMALAEELASK